ncbi:MAG: hypothetical protein ACPW60_07090 [Methylohalobius sp. ZOD2]
MNVKELVRLLTQQGQPEAASHVQRVGKNPSSLADVFLLLADPSPECERLVANELLQETAETWGPEKFWAFVGNLLRVAEADLTRIDWDLETLRKVAHALCGELPASPSGIGGHGHTRHQFLVLRKLERLNQGEALKTLARTARWDRFLLVEALKQWRRRDDDPVKVRLVRLLAEEYRRWNPRLTEATLHVFCRTTPDPGSQPPNDDASVCNQWLAGLLYLAEG